MAAPRGSGRFSDSPYLGGLCVLLFTLLCSLALQSILQNASLATQFFSQGLWRSLVSLLGAEPLPDGLTADPSFGRIAGLNLIGGLLFWTLGAWRISKKANTKFSWALGRWGVCGWLWGTIPVVWEIGRIIAAGSGPNSGLGIFLSATAPLWMGSSLAGWLATFGMLCQKPVPQVSITGEPQPRRWSLGGVLLAVLVYVIVYTAMNWQLYRNLLVPHGDSAMYEEHLWNLTHGKGFRSYLEDRLFLGEHIQVVHLLLLPLHFLWPSLMMMDLCESIALASAAVPIYWITTRHAESSQAGRLVAIGYLFYFPMQYIDIAIDLKTFRPIAFGIPAVLYGIDQLERGRIKTALVCWLIALSAKEDYAIILAPLGLWMALFPSTASQRGASSDPQKFRRIRWLGLGIAVFNTVYLALAVKYLIPWFRSGEEVHYVGYFQQFGNSLEEVIKNIFANPRLLFGELFAVTTFIYAASLLVPLGAMALFSPTRLLVGAPLFMLLCLNQLSHTPHHHFHAPVIPILFWATAVGVGRFSQALSKRSPSEREASRTSPILQWGALFVLTSAFSTGLFTSMSPLGISFWDPHSIAYWKDRYVINERAKKFALIEGEIPKSARVFSTDFVHPRFTHHARSYDYSDYPRKTDAELMNPVRGETYYLVIDTQHPYSTIKKPEDIPEYREHPEDWELLPDKTEGYYIVLRRRNE